MAILKCPKCGAANRVDDRASTLQPVCGRCGQKLGNAESAAQSAPIKVTDQNFSEVVLRAGGKPVLVDCWAPWCGPCRALTPIIDQLAMESEGKYIIGKLNTDENPGIAGQFKIDAIPAMLIFKNGTLVDRIVGLVPKATIESRLMAHV